MRRSEVALMVAVLLLLCIIASAPTAPLFP